MPQPASHPARPRPSSLYFPPDHPHRSLNFLATALFANTIPTSITLSIIKFKISGIVRPGSWVGRLVAEFPVSSLTRRRASPINVSCPSVVVFVMMRTKQDLPCEEKQVLRNEWTATKLHLFNVIRKHATINCALPLLFSAHGTVV